MNNYYFRITKLSTFTAVFLFLACVFSCSNTTKHSEYYKVQGTAQGTYYSITYENTLNKNLKPQFDSILQDFDSTFSNYLPTSLISRINAHDTIFEVNDDFIYFWNTAHNVWKMSNGAFDISIAPLANAWKFGFKNDSLLPTPKKIDSLLTLKAMHTLWIDEHKRLHKANPRSQIIGNAIAQGYSVDVLCSFLDSLGITNYLVDVGGEMRAKGVNHAGKIWSIGITIPSEGVDSLSQENSFAHVLQLNNRALGTSGNYRKFYIVDGKKYSHTLNPVTGYPAQSSILSATVLAPTAIEADALATVCMVLGMEQSIELFKQYPRYDIFLLYDNNGSMEYYASKGIQIN
ncbi:MAG: FAD:protein FMN transferase [Bacteroidales bacterium]|jgi:thiamine biosynthesis lipoprotein|nr:FAD:protein FMN transferase [Bacteroidales bacterium]